MTNYFDDLDPFIVVKLQSPEEYWGKLVVVSKVDNINKEYKGFDLDSIEDEDFSNPIEFTDKDIHSIINSATIGANRFNKEYSDYVDRVKEEVGILESFNNRDDILTDMDQGYDNLLEIAGKLILNSPNKFNYEVQDVFKDFGRNEKWTTIVCYTPNSVHQILNNDVRNKIINASPSELDRLYYDVITQQGFLDRPTRNGFKIVEDLEDTPDIKVGDTIKIIDMMGEPHYKNRVGKVEFIDGIGQLHGTWGGLAVVPEEDIIEKIEENSITESFNEDEVSNAISEFISENGLDNDKDYIVLLKDVLNTVLADISKNSNENEILAEIKDAVNYVTIDSTEEDKNRYILSKIYNKSDDRNKNSFTLDILDIINKIHSDYETNNETLKEDLNEEVMDSLEVKDNGISQLIIDAINKEWEVIKELNDLIVNAEGYGYPDIAEIIKGIVTTENANVGQLQASLETISPNVEAIKDGENIAKQQLDNREI